MTEKYENNETFQKIKELIKKEEEKALYIFDQKDFAFQVSRNIKSRQKPQKNPKRQRTRNRSVSPIPGENYAFLANHRDPSDEHRRSRPAFHNEPGPWATRSFLPQRRRKSDTISPALRSFQHD